MARSHRPAPQCTQSNPMGEQLRPGGLGNARMAEWFAAQQAAQATSPSAASIPSPAQAPASQNRPPAPSKELHTTGMSVLEGLQGGASYVGHNINKFAPAMQAPTRGVNAMKGAGAALGKVTQHTGALSLLSEGFEVGNAALNYEGEHASDDVFVELAGALGSTSGAYYGAAMGAQTGAWLGAFGGPLGALAGAGIGGLVGGVAGSTYGEYAMETGSQWLMDLVLNDHPTPTVDAP